MDACHCRTPCTRSVYARRVHRTPCTLHTVHAHRPHAVMVCNDVLLAPRWSRAMWFSHVLRFVACNGLLSFGSCVMWLGRALRRVVCDGLLPCESRAV